MTSLPDLVSDLAAEHAALDAVVADLDPAAWDAPTPAEGWRVRDAISHLAFFDDKAVLAITDPEAFRLDLAVAVQDIPGYMQAHLDAGRALTPAELLTWWRTSRTRSLELLGALDPGHRIQWYGPSMSAISFTRARVLETWAHGQDVVDALDAHRQPTDRLHHIASLGFATRSFSYVVRGQQPPDAAVRLELTSPSGELWTWGPDDATDTITGSAEDWCLRVVHRRHPDDTDLVAHGPAAVSWLHVAQAFAGGPSDGRAPLGQVE